MANNWAGMFQQMNKAIQGSPVGGDMTQGIMDQMSQSAGGLMGAATGQDPMSFMSQEAKQLQGQDMLAKLDLTTIEGMQQASQLYQQMGDMEKALAFANKAKEMETAENAKNNAILEAQQQGMNEELERKKKRSQKVQAIAIARREGDQEAVAGLQSESIDPGSYLLQVLEKKNKKTTLADGAMMVDADGNVVAHNVKDFNDKGTGELTATMQKRLNTATDDYYAATTAADEAKRLLQMSEKVDLTGGWLGTAEKEFNKATGRREDDDFFRTAAIGLRNREMVNNLPPGIASDKDVQLVLNGYFPDNANKDEIQAFLRGMAKLSEHKAEFSKAKADWIDANGDEGGFISDWQRKMEKKDYQFKVSRIPPQAIQFLQQNPTPENRNRFTIMYKVPAGDFIDDDQQ